MMAKIIKFPIRKIIPTKRFEANTTSIAVDMLLLAGEKIKKSYPKANVDNIELLDNKYFMVLIQLAEIMVNDALSESSE